MKKLYAALLFLCLAITAGASTGITTPTVSGHWSLSGSPYLIYNSIEVAGCDQLIIDPGVEVIFQGNYLLNVSGSLIATGTNAQHILFHVSDTTGWYATNTAGGWLGIMWGAYSCTANDPSSFTYCDVADVKSTMLSGYRAGKLEYCNFYHNIGTFSFTPAGNNFELSHCSFYNSMSDNDTSLLSYTPLMMFGQYATGVLNTLVSMHDCNVYNNISKSSTIKAIYCTFNFEHNSVYGNVATDSITAEGTINISYSKAVVSGNKIYNNTDALDASLHSIDNTITINGNYICNNRSLNGMATGYMCGATMGGGGLRIACDPDSINYLAIVRNNVIANNYSGFGGGGIYIINATVQIINNNIVNNTGFRGGGITFNNYPDTKRDTGTIKNNLFFNNVTVNYTDTGTGPYLANVDTTDVFTDYGDYVRFEHNWVKSPVYNTMQLAYTASDVSSVFILIGDTTTNIIGTNPGMIAPTLTASISESAWGANFGISATSSCINKGTTAGIDPGPSDYLNNIRIVGSAIDIGAYEYGAAPYTGGPEQVATIARTAISVYPNPASTTLFIATPEAKGNITLTDISGRAVAQQPVTTTLSAIDVHSLAHGTYFITWSSGTERSVQKIVVE